MSINLTSHSIKNYCTDSFFYFFGLNPTKFGEVKKMVTESAKPLIPLGNLERIQRQEKTARLMHFPESYYIDIMVSERVDLSVIRRCLDEVQEDVDSGRVFHNVSHQLYAEDPFACDFFLRVFFRKRDELADFLYLEQILEQDITENVLEELKDGFDRDGEAREANLKARLINFAYSGTKKKQIMYRVAFRASIVVVFYILLGIYKKRNLFFNKLNVYGS